MTSPDDLAEVRERVRARYAGVAATVLAGGAPSCREPAQARLGTRLGPAPGTQWSIPSTPIRSNAGELGSAGLCRS
jgi:hypothetical protein